MHVNADDKFWHTTNAEDKFWHTTGGKREEIWIYCLAKNDTINVMPFSGRKLDNWVVFELDKALMTTLTTNDASNLLEYCVICGV